MGNTALVVSRFRG